MTVLALTDGRENHYWGGAMKGWLIFLHSVRLVFSNIETAFRISGALYLILTALQYWFSWKFGPVIYMLAGGGLTPDSVPSGSFFAAWFLYVIASLLITLWIAVAWHRYVLLEDIAPGWIPIWRGERVKAYLGRSIVIGLIVVIAVMCAGVIGGLALVPLGFEMLAALLTIVIAAYMFYRLGAALPAAAVGEKISLNQAWKATANESATLFVLALVTAFGSYLVQLPSIMSNNAFSVIGIIYSVVVGWFITMIGVSVLTTIYGHFIEKRPID